MLASAFGATPICWPAKRSLTYFNLKFLVCYSELVVILCGSPQDVDPPEAPRHNFVTIWKAFCAKPSLLSWRTQPLPRSPCILHQGLWINTVFVLGLHSERRECNGLDLWCGMSKQLLHEWQSQGLVIWTWENPGGAEGQDTPATAAGPHRAALHRPRRCCFYVEKHRKRSTI